MNRQFLLTLPCAAGRTGCSADTHWSIYKPGFSYQDYQGMDATNILPTGSSHGSVNHTGNILYVMTSFELRA